jgi:hypothetical protein
MGTIARVMATVRIVGRRARIRARMAVLVPSLAACDRDPTTQQGTNPHPAPPSVTPKDLAR